MPIAFVQQAVGTNPTSDTSFTVTLAAPPTAGSCLVLVAEVGFGLGISSISGGGVTWVQGAELDNFGWCETWYGLNSSGVGTVITVTLASASEAAANVSEFSGVATSAAIDVTGTAGGSSASPATATLNTTNANDLIIGGVSYDNAQSVTAGPTNSFTALTTTGDGTFDKITPAYRIVSATGAYSTGWTFNVSSDWATTLISLKAVAAPAITNILRRGLYRDRRVR